jgi:hypothetical protein
MFTPLDYLQKGNTLLVDNQEKKMPDAGWQEQWSILPPASRLLFMEES